MEKYILPADEISPADELTAIPYEPVSEDELQASKDELQASKDELQASEEYDEEHDLGASPVTSADWREDAEDEAEADVEEEVETFTEGEAGADAADADEAEAEAEAEADAEADAEYEVETNAEDVVDTDAGDEIDAVAEDEAETDTEDEFEMDSEDDAETDEEDEAEADGEDKIETDAEAGIGADLADGTILDRLIDRAFGYKKAGKYEEAITCYMAALDHKPENNLVFLIILDICTLYKELGKEELAMLILESYAEEYSDAMDETIRYEIERNLLNI